MVVAVREPHRDNFLPRSFVALLGLLKDDVEINLGQMNQIIKRDKLKIYSL